MQVQTDKVDSILDKYEGEKGVLIQVLLDVQKELNWIPPEAIREISQRLEIPITRIYRVASFYKAMSLTPRGRHSVSVCLGTACYVKGGQRILEAFERELGVEVGGTTEDLKFSLETVNCLGCCGQSPVVTVNDDIYGYMKQTQVPKILSEYE